MQEYSDLIIYSIIKMFDRINIYNNQKERREFID